MVSSSICTDQPLPRHATPLTYSAENWSNYPAEFAEFRQLVQGARKVLYLGLPFEFDRRRNWTLLALDAQQVRVDQHDKKGVTCWRIDADSWQHQLLA